MAHPLLLLATGLFVIRLVLFAMLHLLPGGVHPLRETVSDYAASPSARTRTIAAAASWTAATAWAALGAGVLSDAALGANRLGVGAWLIVLGLVVAAMPFVPTDRSGQPATIRGRIHLLLAIGWFTLAYSTIGPLGRLLSGTPAFVVGVLDPVAAVSLAALVISMVFPALRARTFGASERVFILVVTFAPLIAAAALTAR
ncbi:DUF998 domain-containing protein [Microbacterium resistens]|uniref:DUF998 domain-containing protein n=1 Tax=Microbacterium resistens TaxID=156977 RepID=A0ABY3RTC6_9MICO|nr:DUF998 domain-containing protein [Microbacterium resistens]UGS27209.1 DUF998 domain-containing protein [Microbacterium resistens]